MSLSLQAKTKPRGKNQKALSSYNGIESTAYNRLQPPRILAKAPHIMPKPPPYNAKSTQQNAV